MNYPRVPQVAIASEVRAEMARQRMSVTDLSEKSGITYATLRRRLADESAFTVDELASVAHALGVTVSAIVRAAERGAA